MTPATKAKLISYAGSLVLKLLCATLRFRIRDEAGLRQLPLSDRFIGIFWHNRLLVVPWMFTRYMRPRRSSALTSPSKDGEILAACLARFGIGAIRGSSSRRGVPAMIAMKRALESGLEVAITPDGPRGPRYHLHPGVISLAQLADVRVLPIGISYSHYWELKSWDAFRIPYPFATVEVTFLPMQKFPATQSPEEFEQQRTHLEEILRRGNPEPSRAVEAPSEALRA